ncbi:MAG: ABC transporter transmembrane domain-containing protein [bacterium]|nr:ABC transporter transmembrane domain-containing protein [bacterium]
MKSLLVGIMVMLLQIPGPYITKVLIDDVYPHKDYALLGFILILGVVMSVGLGFTGMLSGYYSTCVGVQMGLDYKSRFYCHIQSLDFSFFDSRQTGEVLSRFRDMDSSIDGAIGLINTMIMNTLQLAIFPPILVFINWKLALISLLVLPFDTLLLLVSPVSLSRDSSFPEDAVQASDQPEARTDAVQAMYQKFSEIHPEAAEKMAALLPTEMDLEHGLRVAQYARSIMIRYNEVRRQGAVLFSQKDLMTGFVMGMVHDLGRWNHQGAPGHAKRGADFLRALGIHSQWIQTLAKGVENHHVHVSADDCPLPFRMWPLALAESVIESGKRAILDLATLPTTQPIKDMVICLLNKEDLVPPRSIVRLSNSKNGMNCELAVSLCHSTEEESTPYLLRFAQLDARGRPRPVVLEYRCLIAPGDPLYEGRQRVVVDLLSPQVYKRMCEDYEGLVPVYQRLASAIRMQAPG